MSSDNDDNPNLVNDILGCFFDFFCSALVNGKSSRKICIAVVIFAVTIVILTTTLVPLLTNKNKDDSNNGKFTFIVVCLFFRGRPLSKDSGYLLMGYCLMSGVSL